MSRTGPVHLDGWTRVRKRRGSEHPDRFPPASQIQMNRDALGSHRFSLTFVMRLFLYSPHCLMRQWIHVLRQSMELFAELYAFLHEGGPQISVRGSHLEPGQSILRCLSCVKSASKWIFLEMIVESSFRIQPLAWFRSRYRVHASAHRAPRQRLPHC